MCVPFIRSIAAAALILSGQALAADGFAGDGRVFSGVASDSGEGLIVPQSLVTGGVVSFATPLDSELGGKIAMVTTIGGGDLAAGLDAFPVGAPEDIRIQARFASEDLFWGLTPYVGLNVSAPPSSSERVFQGISRLLPYEAESLGVQGVAGIAYELMPGIGAGLEYRYQGVASAAPAPGQATDNQTIMMRLDLGLN
jgi:hypothetical protein